MPKSFGRRGAVGSLIAALMFTSMAVPFSAMAGTETWKGALKRSAPTKLSFKYDGSKITKFTVPLIGCTSVNGYQTETISIPKIPVHGGHFSITYHVPHAPKEVKVTVKGDIAGKHASGNLHGKGLCDTGPQPFKAKRS